MSTERSKNVIINYDSGVTVERENIDDKLIGRVWTISDIKPEVCDIDLALSIGFPDTYVSWLNNSRHLPSNNQTNSPAWAINKIIDSCTVQTQEIVDAVAKISRDSWNLE